MGKGRGNACTWGRMKQQVFTDVEYGYRMYLPQIWFHLSDPATEDAISELCGEASAANMLI